MGAIDTCGWRRYRIGDLFEVLPTGYVGQGRKIGSATTERDEEHTVPLTAAKNDNNGIMYWGRPGDYLAYGNVIAVIRDGAVSTGRVFAQEAETGVYSHSYIIRVKGHDVTFPTNLFLATVLEKVIYPRYSREDACIWKRVRDDEVSLPTNDDGEPDWDHMDELMRHVMDDAASRLDILSGPFRSMTPVGTEGWRRFRIGDLFDIVKGTRLTRANMIPGDTPFIGATRENNGITAHIGNTGHLHPGGTMTVAYNGQKATGAAFWQPVEFWASDDVNVLYPKFDLTREIALFLVPIFWEVGKPYAFDDKWRQDVMANDELTLPAVPDGGPDWDGMQRHMEAVLASAGQRVDSLSSMAR